MIDDDCQASPDLALQLNIETNDRHLRLAALDESARHLDREFRTFLKMVEKAKAELAAAHEYLATLKS